MSVLFPTTLDTLTNPTDSQTLDAGNHTAQHGDANDAVEALEAKVGVNSSAVATSLDYKVTNASSTSPGHKHAIADVTDITADAAEVNKLDGATPGTNVASKALVVDANKAISELRTAALYLGAGAGTQVTSDAGELNITDGGNTTEKVLNVNCKVSAYLSATQENLVDNTWTKVLLDTENYDIGSDFASNKFTAPINGYYLVTAQITFVNTVADKEFDLAIYKSGVLSYLTAVRSGSASSIYVPFAPRILYLTATQYLELYARAIVGVSTVDVIGGDIYTFMTVHLLSV